MHGKNMDTVCEMENQHLHLEASPRPFPHVDPIEIAFNPSAKKAKEKLEKRFNGYKSHAKSKKEHHTEVACANYADEIRDNTNKTKNFLETKAKKSKKDKGDKNAKKTDVLSVSLINDENRSAAAYHRTNNVPSVNGGLASPTGTAPVKQDQFDRDLPSNGTSDTHSLHGNHEIFSTRYFSALDELPDLLAAPGSLDELLPSTDDQGLNYIDVGNMLDEMSHELSGEFKQQVDSLDFCFSPQQHAVGGGREVKMESAFLMDELSTFPNPADATGTFSARSAALTGPNLSQQHHQRISPDHNNNVRSTLDTKRLAQDEALILAKQHHHQQNLLMQQQQQQQRHTVMQQYLPSQTQQKSISPFGGGDPAASTMGIPVNAANNMCFSPVTSDVPASYATNPNAQHNAGYPGARQQPYDANQAMNRQQVMRMNQGSPGAAGVNLPNGGRWPGEAPVPQLTYHQQKQMSLASGTELPYNGPPMHTIGHMGPGGQGKQVFLQGYPPNQMAHRAQGLSGPYTGYVSGNNSGGGAMPRPQQQQQQQYRGMMPNGQPVSMQQQQQQTVGKMYPGAGGAGGGGPYAGHMQQPTVYQQNMHNAMEQQAAMRQMTGYRPQYNTPQQPVQVQHLQQQPNFMTSSNVNPAGTLQQAQQAGFYPMQQQQQQQQPNGFSTGDQMNYQHQNQPDMYGTTTWSS